MANKHERGAAAVEFALLVPFLIMIVLGIVEFGRAYNAQVTLTNAAREGTRTMAIEKSQEKARAAARNAASHLSPAVVDGNVAFSATNCPSGEQMTVTITYHLATITGIAGPFTMIGKGTMLCGG